MKTLLLVNLVVAATLSNVATAQCILYEHDNYEGAQLQLKAGERLENLEGPMISTRSWHGYLGGWQGRDRSWNDEASSVSIGEGCSLLISEHKDGEGRTLSISRGRLSLVSQGWNDIVTSAYCKCEGASSPDMRPAGSNTTYVSNPRDNDSPAEIIEGFFEDLL